MRAIGLPFTPEESAAFVVAARSQLNVRFRHMGRNERGFDCAGLVLWSLRSLGKPVVDIAAYGREPHKDGLREAIQANLGDPVPLDDLRPGDVVLMRFEGEPRHVGILFAHPEGLGLVHTYATVKRVTEHRLDAYWRGCITEAYRP